MRCPVSADGPLKVCEGIDLSHGNVTGLTVVASPAVVPSTSKFLPVRV